MPEFFGQITVRGTQSFNYIHVEAYETISSGEILMTLSKIFRKFITAYSWNNISLIYKCMLGVLILEVHHFGWQVPLSVIIMYFGNICTWVIAIAIMIRAIGCHNFFFIYYPYKYGVAECFSINSNIEMGIPGHWNLEHGILWHPIILIIMMIRM